MILFRADGNSEIGVGHIMRCLSIADALADRGCKAAFVCAGSNVRELIRSRGFECFVLGTDYRDMEHELDAFRNLPCYGSSDVIVVDSYFTTDDYLKTLKSEKETVFIDDYPNKRPVSALVNYNIYADPGEYKEKIGEPGQKLFAGPAYAPVRKEFQNVKPIGIKDKARKVLFLAGGSDPAGAAVKFAKEVLKHDDDLEFSIVMGRMAQSFDEVSAMAESSNGRINAYRDVQDMAGMMLDSDIAVSASGSTLYELCRCGVPTIDYILADNQRMIAEGFAKAGAMICMGDLQKDETLFAKLYDELTSLADDKDKRMALSEKASKLVDGKGAARLAEGIMNLKTKRIYVCHTFYHLYISFLKEFAQPEEERGNAAVVLSLMSNDFGDIKDRIVKSGIFTECYEYDEKPETFFPELGKWKKDRGNIVSNMFSRIVFTSKFAKLQAKYVPVDFRKYEDIWVFCDGDPIGYYLNKNRIHYHAVEDGLDYLGRFVMAMYTNKGHFGIKKFFSMNLNLIFMQDGYSKYCDDMEVNDLSVIKYPFYKYKEIPRKGLEESITDEQKEILTKVFVKDIDRMRREIGNTAGSRDNILILTEPLCAPDVRERIFRDLYDRYSKEGNVFFKIHPRDELDYEKLFSDVYKFDKTVPMEILNFFGDLRFKKVVSVFTELGSIKFADEKEQLGPSFMDKYEDPEIHNKGAKI